MKSTDYILHFRNAGVPFVIVELTFNKNAYGVFDYVLLYKDELAEGYLSKKGLAQARKFGMQLFDNYEDVLKKLNSFKEKLNNFKYTSWEDLKKVLREFGEYYRYCEQPMLAGIEEILVKNCPNIEQCLANPNNSNLNKEAKKALDILTKFGKAKYDLHIAVEKPIRAVFEVIQNMPSAFTLTEKEIDEILSDKNSFKKPAVKRDKIAFAEGKVQYNYDFWKEKVKPEFSDQIKVIKGTGVSSGKAQGKVKIFISSIDYEEIPEGAVLVTGMTNPQLVPYLKKAAAIVTDEGGITCHAAIISREMHKPCVVGTLNATQILKDGDEVEVDANHSVVKIFRKK
jgi:phosphohistidine swiveling domain-containing protein